MTTITMPRRLMRPVASRPARRSMLIGFAGTLLLGLLVVVGLSLGLASANAGRVLPGVSVAGVELAGLTREAARDRLADRLPALAAGEAIIAVDDTEVAVAYADLGRGYEMDRMLDAAFGVGRGGNALTDGVARLRSLAHDTALPVIVRPFEADALERITTAIAADLTTEPVDATVTADGTTFTFTPSATGRVVDAAELQTALAAAVDNDRPQDVRIELTARVVQPAVASAEARDAAAAATVTIRPLELTVPGAAEDEEPITLTSETLAAMVTVSREGDSFALEIDEAQIATSIEALVEQVDQGAVNARIVVANGKGLAGVVPGQTGRALNVEASVASVLAALTGRGEGEESRSVPLVVDVTEPGVTTAQAEAALPQMRMVSSWTTYYVPGEGNAFGKNINIPAFDIDGTNLAPGEWFSFWGSVGPITEERGFGYGGAIIDGRSTQGVAIGGGICSTSTTIFNAALRAGLEMGERLNHYYYIDRYPDGLDATVSIIDGWMQDMTFRNDTANPIVVRGFGGNGSVTFEIWSVPLNRQVVITDAVTSNHRKASDTTQVDPSMAPGTSKRVEYPHDGHDVSRTRFVYDAAGNLLHRNDYFSSYRTVNGITLVGPSAEAAPPPADAGGETAGDGVVPPGDETQP